MRAVANPTAGSQRIGLALGAGSATAMAQIGAVEVLSEAGIPIDCVAGTSAGAVVAAAFASNHLPELHERLAGLSWRQVLSWFDLSWPREGVLHGRRALDALGPLLGERIESLPLPFAAVATDLHTGDEVALTSGPVFDALRASIAIPGLFRPWTVAGRLLVDGGLVNPVPVSVARSLGADFVIAVNVLPLRPDQETGGADVHLGLIETVNRALRIMEARVASSRLREDEPDWLLQISAPGTGMFDLHHTHALAEVGRQCAMQALPEILRALEAAQLARAGVRQARGEEFRQGG